jgi:hypothetical protein
MSCSVPVPYVVFRPRVGAQGRERPRRGDEVVGGNIVVTITMEPFPLGGSTAVL